jgi:hypothetical protein
MRHRIVTAALLAIFLISSLCPAQPPNSDETDQPSLTIYNQQFAVVRHTLPLNLKAGRNHVEVNDISTHLEPDSVILRPIEGRQKLQVLEQNYRNDPISQQLLLSLYEGKTIDFELPGVNGAKSIVKGKIIRSGYVPHYTAMRTYDQRYAYMQQAYIQGGSEQPVIEVDGRLQFSLPGQPLFPALADDTVLKPTLSWELNTDRPGTTRAEFSYVTGGMSWEADYNVVAPVKGNVLEMVGWVTLDNQSGKTFQNARIKLMAGDVNKIQPGYPMSVGGMAYDARSENAMVPPVKERSFDEYHLYTLQNSTTLHDRETKQVEFVRAEGIQSSTIYVYDGFQFDERYRGWNQDSIRNQPDYGTQWNSKVWTMQEFKNTSGNNLGIPLPKGRVRFYRRDEDGQLEFTGENTIDHTPEGETIRLYTGNAFDLVGERHRMSFRIDTDHNWIDESFQIKLRNHKKQPVTVRVIEHLYRCDNWQIVQESDKHKQNDSHTAEFTIELPPDGERTLNYMVHYTW